MNEFKQYRADVEAFVGGLTEDQAIAYGLLTANRYCDFYQSFYDRERFGDLDVLFEISEAAFHSLLEIETTVDFEELKTRIDNAIPDSEEFGDSADALDAGVIHYYLIDFLITPDKSNIKHIANLIYDLSDRYAHDAIGDALTGKEREDAIEAHDILKENLKNETEIFAELSKIHEPADLVEYVKQKSERKFRLS